MTTEEKFIGDLEGYLVIKNALSIDEVIKLIKKSKDPVVAREALMSRFSLSERQAKAILEMRLQRLTSLEVDKIVAEYKELLKLIEKLQTILDTLDTSTLTVQFGLLSVKTSHKLHDNFQIFIKNSCLFL